MPDVDQAAPAGDTQFLTPESAAPMLEALLFPAEADTDETSEPTADEAEPVTMTDDATPEADAEAVADEDTEPAEGEPDASPDAPDEPSHPRTVRIKLGDAEEEVTEDELIKGYTRHADYTRKTQALAEARKTLDAKAAEVTAHAERYAAALQTLEQALTPAAPPDWAALRAELPPEQFAAEWATYQQAEQQRATVRAERQAAEAQALEGRRQQMQQALATERAKLLEAIPEWRDEATATTERAQLLEFARAKGYTDAELAAVTDHRIITLLRNAMRWERAMQQTPTTTSKKPAAPAIRPAAPGGGAPRKAPTAAERAAQRLAHTGSVDDAAALFEHLLP